MINQTGRTRSLQTNVTAAMDGESSKIQEINDVRDNDELEDQNESDDDLGEDGPSSEQSSSKKKKKKKKSKAAKLLSALSKNEIPQELVDQVMDQVKAEGSIQSGEVTETAVREALEQMKLADFVKGKAGLGGNNQKDLGKHKVPQHLFLQGDIFIPGLSFGRPNRFLK